VNNGHLFLYLLTSIQDPKTIYDEFSDRHIVVALVSLFCFCFLCSTFQNGKLTSTSMIHFAISNGSFPSSLHSSEWIFASMSGNPVSGGWSGSLSLYALFPLSQKSYFSDYPSLASDRDFVYLSANLFNDSDFPHPTFGSYFWAMEKSEFLVGNIVVSAEKGLTCQTVQPAHVLPFSIPKPGS